MRVSQTKPAAVIAQECRQEAARLVMQAHQLVEKANAVFDVALVLEGKDTSKHFDTAGWSYLAGGQAQA